MRSLSGAQGDASSPRIRGTPLVLEFFFFFKGIWTLNISFLRCGRCVCQQVSLYNERCSLGETRSRRLLALALYREHFARRDALIHQQLRALQAADKAPLSRHKSNFGFRRFLSSSFKQDAVSHLRWETRLGVGASLPSPMPYSTENSFAGQSLEAN